MKGFIRLLTPSLDERTELEHGNQIEVYEKSKQLKEDFLKEGQNFLVYVQMQSKMNEPGFEINESKVSQDLDIVVDNTGLVSTSPSF